MISRIGVVLLMGLLGMLYLATQLPPSQESSELDDQQQLPVTSTRIRLSDGRYLAYREKGVPKHKSNHKIILIHGFGSSKEMNFLATQVQINLLFPFSKPSILFLIWKIFFLKIISKTKLSVRSVFFFFVCLF